MYKSLRLSVTTLIHIQLLYMYKISGSFLLPLISPCSNHRCVVTNHFKSSICKSLGSATLIHVQNVGFVSSSSNIFVEQWPLCLNEWLQIVYILKFSGCSVFPPSTCFSEWPLCRMNDLNLYLHKVCGSWHDSLFPTLIFAFAFSNDRSVVTNDWNLNLYLHKVFGSWHDSFFLTLIFASSNDRCVVTTDLSLNLYLHKVLGSWHDLFF